MANQYHMDLAKYSLGKFNSSLKSREMIPSRVILKDKLDERFKILETSGITNLKELTDRLKTKVKIEQFSKETGLSIEYLTLLNREAKSYLPSPIRLDKFPGIPNVMVKKLETEGIKNSRHLLYEAGDKIKRDRLSQHTEIPLKTINELVGLSDLARAYGVGPVFARLLYDVGITSIKDFVAKTAEEIIRIYEEKEQKKADFGVHEMQFSLELAKELDIMFEG
jgi:hypothetical protein